MSIIATNESNPSMDDKVKFTTFSDGSETCLVNTNLKGEIVIFVEVEDATRDLIRIGLVKDALDRNPAVTEVQLAMPYFPQARADRVFQDGAPLPLKVFANIINSYKFSRVVICDPHSDVTSALVDNVVVIDQGMLMVAKGVMKSVRKVMPNPVLLAPDLGAAKKMHDTMTTLGFTSHIQATKIRDVKTGSIIECKILSSDLNGQDVLIIDDISDGGASFVHLARKLKNLGAGKIGLYVTHGIFAKELYFLEDDIDYIYCSHLIGNYVTGESVQKFNERHND